MTLLSMYSRCWRFWQLVGCLVVLSTLATIGCSRSFYRKQADGDAYELISEKTCDPRWDLQDYEIELDPRSRMFDPFDRDRPPMPEDDPASHELMHRVDGKKGWKHWHDNGETNITENPEWLQYLPFDEDGILVLDAVTAMQVALLNSRDYQLQLEELYLSALDVSFERFRFDSQFFGGAHVDYAASGPLRSGRSSGSSILTTGLFPTARGLRMEKLGATGSDLVVGLANSLVWQFAGPDEHSVNTLLDFALVQPLLRRGGRERVMERLTLSERTLLSNVRAMERYRRGFYLEIMTGVDAGQGPSRRGGVFGSGFEGFQGVGGGFGGVGGTGGGFATGGTGAGQAGGFMGLLQQQQEIRNQENNLNDLRRNFRNLTLSLEEMLRTVPSESQSTTSNSEPVLRQRLQVAQAKQAMLDAESRLINAKASYQATLDRFKITLGLPPEICVTIKDPMLDSVNLVDPLIQEIQLRVSVLQDEVGNTITRMLPAGEEDVLVWNDGLASDLQTLRTQLDAIDEIRDTMLEGPDAQIQRIRLDGSKLTDRLAETIQAAIDGESDQSPEALADLKEDLLALQGIQTIVGDAEDWLTELSGIRLQLDEFDGLVDAVRDLQKLDRQFQQADPGSIAWLLDDSNVLTQALYQQYDVLITALGDLDAVQRQQALDQLRQQVTADLATASDRVSAFSEEEPLAARLHRWLTAQVEDRVAVQDDVQHEVERLERLFAQFVAVLGGVPRGLSTLPERVQSYRDAIDQLIAEGPDAEPDELMRRFRREISPTIPQELVDLSDNLLELSLVQASARTETVSLVDINLHPAAAMEIARRNRRDWMNARASLVDKWRLIAFTANDLESSLDVVFSGDISNVGKNPLNLNASDGRLRVGLQFDAPLTRLSERNTYRQALIEYQQARRGFYAMEDGISQGLRSTVRTILLNKANLDIRRDAVRSANGQVKLNDDIATLQIAAGQPSRDTAARDTVSALSDVLRAQNDFLSVWVTYEVIRRTLDYDLGTMELDSLGMWIDPGEIGPDTGYPGLRQYADDLEPFNDDCWPREMVYPAGYDEGGHACVGDQPLEVAPPAPDGADVPAPLAPELEGQAAPLPPGQP